MSICEMIKKDISYLIMIIICAACGIALGVFSIFHWIDFINTAGTYVILPGIIGLLRVLFESSYSWVKQDLFWLSFFTSTIAYTFIFLPYIGIAFDEKDVIAFINTENMKGFGKFFAWIVNIIVYLLAAVAVVTLILSVLGSGVLTIIYILRYKGNALVSSIVSLNTAIVEMIFVAPFAIALVVILITKRFAR